ncbi:5-oxoprolinase subunit PxpA [Yeosuana marina]|uniref:5-oxoprolinase subunit PxpA n=1 Tax=Yeosuana marina TaxID=1565536 RepID=UPI0030C846F0
MNTKFVDINVDVGEGIGNESKIFPYISSCNIACGGHAGDKETMRQIIKLSKAHRVKIGAHPSFPDREHFGRKPMDITCAALYTSLKEQIDDLMSVLSEEQARLNHVKPHGALYNLAAIDKKIATVIVEVIKSFMLPIKLYVPFKSVIEKLATENKIPIIYEVFADRNYNDDLTLVSRNDKNALIEDPEAVFKHMYRMIQSDSVKTLQGHLVPIQADTFCIHGDNPNVITILKFLKKEFKAKQITIA